MALNTAIIETRKEREENMKRMNFPGRKIKRREEAEARNTKTAPSRRKTYRLAHNDSGDSKE